MFFKELFEDRNDVLTKDGYMSHLDKEQAKATRAKKDESKPSASSMLRNWIERNNASSESDQILYALVRDLEKLDPSITEKILSFFVGQVMQRTKGRANPSLVNEILKEKIKNN